MPSKFVEIIAAIVAPLALLWLGAARADGRTEPIPASERRRIQDLLACTRGGAKGVFLLDPASAALELKPLLSGPLRAGPATPDGAALLLLPTEEDAPGPPLRLLPLRPQGAPRPLGPTAGHVRDPSWAPDGRWLVFESGWRSEHDLYRVDRDGGGLRRLTDNPEGNFQPAVSPRGSAIAFLSSRDHGAELYRMQPDGSTARRLTHTPKDEWAPAWAPDASLLSFLSDRDGADRIYLMRPDGARVRRLSAEDLNPATVEEPPTWSPRGLRLAYTLRRSNQPARLRVVTLANDGRGGRAGSTTEVALPAGASAAAPAFSPDGAYLAFTVTQPGAAAQLYLARADGSGATALTQKGSGCAEPRWIRRAPAQSAVPGKRSTRSLRESAGETPPDAASG